MSIGVRYVHKWVDYAIEAVCKLRAVGRGVRRQQPGLRQRLGSYPFGTQPAGAARSGARLRRRRGPAAQAAVEPLVARRQLSATATCAATGRASRAPTRRSASLAAELGPRPSTCCTTRTTRRATRATAASAPIARTSSRCRRPTIIPWGTMVDVNVARRSRRAAVDGHDRKEHDVLSRTAAAISAAPRRFRRST